MKRIIKFLLFILLIIPCKVRGQELIPNAKSGILVEVDSGAIIFEKNINDKLSVASMTKMVAQIIILENIESGNLTWDEQIKVSENAANMGGTQIWLQAGEIMTVKDLFKGISMASANDATVALAERIAGTEKKFVEMMNNKAKELGLVNTHFVNPTGLDEENHYSTAFDLSVIGRALLKHEKILEFSSVYEDYLRQDTDNKFWLVNTNKLVRFYEGADGLKTGFTDNALYCMAVTAKKDNMRLLAITLGEPNGSTRNDETTTLLNYGFNLYTVDQLNKKNETIKEIKLNKSNINKVNLVLLEDVSVLREKSVIKGDYQTELKLLDFKLPIKKGDKIGNLIIKSNGVIVREVPITVDQEVKKATFINLFWQNLRNIITGCINI
ncbi:MAG: D-alanyl-D-alanine carboxypeptidase [Tenericutes bacterium]|nr:D-alanyl-D-alanine carboxypeptidase [Mycoplasmatota bacterium]